MDVVSNSAKILVLYISSMWSPDFYKPDTKYTPYVLKSLVLYSTQGTFRIDYLGDHLLTQISDYWLLEIHTTSIQNVLNSLKM